MAALTAKPEVLPGEGGLPNMTDIQKPPHATVKWKHRSTPQEEVFATYQNGQWEIETCDQDGDLAYWSVSFKGEVLAKGEVTNTFGKRCDQDIAMDTALACMYAIQAERKDDDH